MGEGNAFHKLLIEPNQIKLLKIRRGDLILDVACGNGQFAVGEKLNDFLDKLTQKTGGKKCE